MSLPTIILRHRRENLKKCSLRGLEKSSDFLFFTYPKDPLPELTSYILLKVGAPPLTKEDKNKGLLLLDATWRLAPKMEQHLPPTIALRSIPYQVMTAYPRRQTDCSNPNEGLASVEALFLALHFLERNTDHVLDHYHWKEPFIANLLQAQILQ